MRPLLSIKSFSRFLILLLIVQLSVGFFAFPVNQAKASGTTYYVDNCVNVGSDSYDGTEQTHTTGNTGPWQTIAKVNSSTFNPGDSILFESGCTWREQLNVPSSGNASSSITFGAYGSGAKPIISGANLETSWTTETSSTAQQVKYVQGNVTDGDPNASGTFSLAFTSNNTAGNTIIIVVSHNNLSYSSFNASDTQGNTYLTATSVFDDINIGRNKIFYAANIKGGANTVTISGLYPSGYTHIGIYEYSGIATSTPLDVTAAATSSTGTALNSGSATTASNAELIFGLGSEASGVLSAGAGFTARLSDGFLAEDKTVTSTGSYNATESDSTSTEWMMQMATFKAAASSTTSIYYATSSVQPNQVFRDTALLTSVAAKASLATGDWWWDATNSRIYVYDNPAGHTIEASQRNYGIYEGGKSYLTIQNLETDEANVNGMDFNGGGGSIATGITALRNANTGLDVDTNTSATVSYSTAAYNGGDGFDGYASPGLLFDHLTAHNNSFDSTKIDTAGIEFEDVSTGNWPGTAKTAVNNIVQYSQSYDNGAVGSLAAQGLGIWADTIGDGFTVRYNYIHDNSGAGIFAEKDSNVSVYDNIVSNNSNNPAHPADVVGGIVLYMDCSAAGCVMTNSLVANNVVYNNYGHGLRMLASSVAGGCVNNQMSNNISLSNTWDQVDVNGGCDNPGINGSGNVYTYNDFGAPSSNFLTWGGSTYSTYATWEAATGNCGTAGCSHSVQSNPLFTDLSGSYSTSTDFTLTSSSPAIDAGLNLGTTYDMGLDPASTWPSNIILDNQNSYGSGWEMGAYVYTQTSTPSVAMTAPANLATVSSTVTISASSTAARPASIASVQFYLDGSPLVSPVTSTSSPNTYSYSWNTASSTNASHTLYALATDNYSNTATSTSITVTVANKAVLSVPTSTLTFSAAHGSTATSSQSIVITNNGTAFTTLNWSVTSTQPWLAFSKSSSSIAGGASTTVAFIVNPATLALGTYNVTATIADPAASSSPQSLPVTLTISATGIAASITSPSTGAAVSGIVPIVATATSTVGISSVQFYLDGSPLGALATSSPYGVSWNAYVSSNGSHTLYALATDNDANTASSPAITVTVANAPSVIVSVGGGYGIPNYGIAPAPTPTPTPTTTTSTASTSSLTAELASLQAQLAALLAQANAPISSSTPYVFTRNLGLWDRGTDVQALQEFLISKASGPAAAKLKAHGVSLVFGFLTYNALVELQTKAGITPTSGYFGPKTRAWVNSH